MGIPYALIKRDKPEVFDLGKGSVSYGGWQEVFERRLGMGTYSGEIGTFLNPINNLDPSELKDRIQKFDNGASGADAAVLAKRIIDWMGDDVCFLTNGWEELQYMIDDKFSARKIAKEFNDISALISSPLVYYTETGDIWGSHGR